MSEKKKKFGTFEIAEIAYNTNRKYSESIGEKNIPDFKDCGKELIQSVISGVNEVIKNPGMTAKQSHLNWLKKKIDAGWKYGKIKDVKKKEHPDILAFCDLPKDQQVKSSLFVKTVLDNIGKM